MLLSEVDFGDIQGLVRFGHAHLKGACFFLLKVENAKAAKRWLYEKTATKTRDTDERDPLAVTTAGIQHPLPCSALQVAFTYQGLKALGIPSTILDDFSYEFISGMAEESRARRLGDVEENCPEQWLWGGPGEVPHVLVMLYAKTPERLQALQSKFEREVLASGFALIPHRLTTGDMGGKEPFGFKDGVSQPEIDWERRKSTRWKLTRDYTNLSALGEFVLGYPNEYGKYTDRPLIDPRDDPDRILPLAEDRPGKHDFGRNGTFLVLRDLVQDVRGFWQFVDEQAGHDAQKRWGLAHAMIGRMMSGDPIIRLRGQAIEGVGPKTKDIWNNQFTFEDDPDGIVCPFGAHIRRANPRNPDLPYGTSNIVMKLVRLLGFGSRNARDGLPASTRFHRILRRGREYGTWLSPEKALALAEATGGEEARGLRFVSLGASILRQFEFVQTSWLASSKFDGLTDESDPLVGNRVALKGGTPTDKFTLPQNDGPPQRICGLPRFVTVRGGAYFFLPGLSALRYIARV